MSGGRKQSIEVIVRLHPKGCSLLAEKEPVAQ